MVADSTKTFPAKRLFGRQWNNQGKQAHTTLMGNNSNERVCHECEKKRNLEKDYWYKQNPLWRSEPFEEYVSKA
jgi:hypothetical protein